MTVRVTTAMKPAANVPPKPVRTVRRQPDVLPEPIPKSPAKRSMAPPVTASAISAPTLVTNPQPLPNKALVRQADIPARRLRKTERPAGSEDLLPNVRPVTLPGWRTAAAKLTPKAGIILQTAPPADRYAVNVKPKPAPTAPPPLTPAFLPAASAAAKAGTSALTVMPATPRAACAQPELAIPGLQTSPALPIARQPASTAGRLTV